MAAIAQQLGAPTGSIYHRYRSRELLLAELWLSVVEEFQAGVLAELDQEDSLQAGIAAAQFMPRWVRANMREARLLLVHHREDFVEGAWPDELVHRATALAPQIGGGLKKFCRRHWGSVSSKAMRRARFALLDVPHGAVKPYVREGREPPPLIDELIRDTCVGVLKP